MEDVNIRRSWWGIVELYLIKYRTKYKNSFFRKIMKYDRFQRSVLSLIWSAVGVVHRRGVDKGPCSQVSMLYWYLVLPSLRASPYNNQVPCTTPPLQSLWVIHSNCSYRNTSRTSPSSTSSTSTSTFQFSFMLFIFITVFLCPSNILTPFT